MKPRFKIFFRSGQAQFELNEWNTALMVELRGKCYLLANGRFVVLPVQFPGL